MVSSTETTASTSMVGVTPPSHLLPKGPAIELMDTLLPPTTKNLLATAGVGRGRKPRTLPHVLTAPCLCQMRLKAPPQQAPTPGQQEAMPPTPYQQQVFPPNNPAPKPSATPSTSQDQGDPAGGARGRSSSRGPQGGREGADPPPEDLVSVDGLTLPTAYRIGWPTMCPQAGMGFNPLYQQLLGGPDRVSREGQVASGHH